jgi:oxygen-independent coproporphyrinogen-3 oxidase
MAGIYIHIPFCKKRCTYCDFYTEVAPQFIPELIKSIGKELLIRKDYTGESEINTIYFGGGTPSILNNEQFKFLFNVIQSNYVINSNAEITFEANPDDLNSDFFKSIKSLPFNRISIGIQSFNNDDLKRLNRRHNSNQAIEAVENAKKAGFNNISIDLIYGLPFQTIESWNNQLEMAFSLGIQHISAYGLTYEEGTKLWKQREKGEIKMVDDETMNEMYLILLDTARVNGFEAYEISNFARPGFRSNHNTSYWKQEPYIGVGPSAHSYNLKSRQWSIASINKYMHAIESNKPFFEVEELTVKEQFNDYVLVSIRTSDGTDVSKIERDFGKEFADIFTKSIQKYIENGKVIQTKDNFVLSRQGILISNRILIDLIQI